MEPPADLASVGTLVPYSDEHYMAPKQSITSAWGKTSKGATTGGGFSGSQDSPHPHLRRERVELLRANVVHAGAERRALAAAYTMLSTTVAAPLKEIGMEPPADLASVGTLVPHSDEHYLAPKQSITSAWGKTSKGMTTGGSQDSPHPHLRRERVELLRANVVHAAAERRALAAAYTTLSMAVQSTCRTVGASIRKPHARRQLQLRLHVTQHSRRPSRLSPRWFSRRIRAAV